MGNRYTLNSSFVGIEKEINKDSFSVEIGITVLDSEKMIPTPFVITVVSDQSLTGYEVDAQREKEINDFIENLK